MPGPGAGGKCRASAVTDGLRTPAEDTPPADTGILCVTNKQTKMSLSLIMNKSSLKHKLLHQHNSASN